MNKTWYSLIKNKIGYTCVVYVLILLTYRYLSLFFPFYESVYKVYGSYISAVTVGSGCAIVLFEVSTNRSFLKKKHSLWLMIVYVACIVSSLFYYREVLLTENIKSIVWMSIQLFLIYTASMGIEEELLKKIAKKFYLCASVYLIILIFYSFQMAWSLVDEVLILKDGIIVRLGFDEGRLFGIFSHLPQTATVIGVHLLASIYYFVTDHGCMMRVFHGLFFVVFFLYEVMAGARAVLLALIVLTAAITVLLVKKNCERASIPVLIFSGLFAGIACYILWTGTHGIFTSVLKTHMKNEGLEFHTTVFARDDASKEDFQIATEKAENNNQSLERPDASMNNVSNNRFAIWKDYAHVLFSSPKYVLFGFSINQYGRIIQKEFPDIYIVQKIKRDSPTSFAAGNVYNTHNGFLHMFVSGGIFAFIALICYVFFCLNDVLLYLSKKKIIPLVLLLVSVVSFLLICEMFDDFIFAIETIISSLFWFFSGWLTHKLQKEENEKLD